MSARPRRPKGYVHMFLEQLPEFLLNHPALVLAFCAILGALIWTQIQAGTGPKLSPSDATRLISHEDAVVLDVRSDREFRQRHILNAINIPLEQLAAQVKKLERHRARPIITVCKNGQQSAAAIKTLRGLGFEKLYTINGGIAGWEGANLPLAKDSK